MSEKPAGGEAETIGSERWSVLERHGLMEALRGRRSRRFSAGMSIPRGPLAHESGLAPRPLNEEEQAVLAFAACGITGAALADWPYAEGTGGHSMARAVGRTASSPDAVQSAAVFVIDDEATWLARRPQDLEPTVLAEVIERSRAGRYVDAWRAMRVRIADGRLAPPRDPPFNFNANRWSLYAEGTTYFLPVSSLTFGFINVLLELLSAANGFFLVDERRMFQPAGLKRFARSRGGHLDDDPRNGKALPLAYFERTGVEMMVAEQGMILQNLGLACHAMGLSGFPHYAQHDEAWFEALGFRLEQMPLTEFMAVPFPASAVSKITGKNPTMSYPVGLEHDGEVLLRSHSPPYFASMRAAVEAVLTEKFGPGGIYAGGEPGVYRHRDAAEGWEDPDRTTRDVPGFAEDQVAAAVAVTEYIWDRYGRYPATYPPFHTALGFQAGHVDHDFYRAHYRPEALGDSHRTHDDDWHPDTA